MLVPILLTGLLVPEAQAGAVTTPPDALTEQALPERAWPELDRKGGSVTVTESVRLAPGSHLEPPVGEAGEAGVIVLRGLEGVTLDLGEVELRGQPADADLDAAAGYGVLLEDCRDVTLRGGTLGGFRGCVVARRCSGLTIEDVSFDGWFGQRLRSTPAAEDASDWLWPHDNDEGEWLAKYGAAISLTDCADFSVRRCRGRRGQNGLLLTRSSEGEVYDCDFSFLSGWGLGMYRSSRNTICRNRFDYCVRGYSDGVYWRGQDSAGILMFERCSDNVVALNSATHGGDGLFLFAGQDIVEGRAFERGEPDPGGSDRNLFWSNDCSYAVANAFELTFSRGNQLLGNRGRGSHQHGLWGGYSSRMLVRGNDFSGTRGGGITVEHGQECAFEGNRLTGCETGLELYWDEDPALVEGPFGQRFDTASRDLWVAGNTFADNGRDLFVDRSSNVRFGANLFGADPEPDEGGDAPGLELVEVDSEGIAPAVIFTDAKGRRATGTVRSSSIGLIRGRAPISWFQVDASGLAELPGEADFRRPDGDERPAGLATIVMGEWGPWDFEAGHPRPEPRPVGGLLADAEWEAVWFSWRDRADPREDLDAWRGLADDPAETGVVSGWANPFGGHHERRRRLGTEFLGLRATASIELQAGRYELEVVSDDGVRILVDGREVLEHWQWHAPTVDRAEFDLEAGAHLFELEYYQIQGALALGVTCTRVGP